jgi:MtaA/CmuA family methyltransferase
MIDKIPYKFIPIVTIYTLASEEFPLVSIMNDDKLLAEAFLIYKERVGYESFIILTDSTFTAEALGCQIRFKGNNEVIVYRELEISTIDEIERLELPDPENCGRLALTLKAVQRVYQYASPERVVIANSTAPLTTAAKLIGLENLLKKIIQDPAFSHALLDKITDFIITLSRSLIRSGAQILFIAEPVASPTLISPKVFRKFVLPCVKRLIQSARCSTILHICGDVTPILNDMAEADPTLLSLDQCVNLNSARALLGDKITLGGNLDPGSVLNYKTPEQISEDAWGCCKEGGPDNFVLMPGCTILAGTPIENIRAMIKVAHEALS